ncbi:MAG: DNA polymerase III subunit gamma/tau [Alphaproteobacteria bacterium]|nr:DNA polymerase III subunit gamma/tau [Alphaproteobacteria bacterium]
MNDDSQETTGQGKGQGEGAPATGPAYQVLARKYRPQTFAEMIGQDALVRTLTNAIAADRLAHAWLLTGVRGVGKTTAARIIALALNCTGADGAGGPTPSPCGACADCVAITEGRHPDILEMDAASRTGVDDVRQLIEGVAYRPTSARYKVYIIDEVHMLSTNAFNALLKTLEEPPEHVKFVFATTEVRKVPVTVVSRCQRFDLRRIAEDELARHFAAIAEAEGVAVDQAALRLIARAADGSVRDGLSILDQALATDGQGAGIGEDAVRAMLGLADRSQVFTLFESVMKGEIGPALAQLSELYAAGADAECVMGDLLDLTHWLTRVKITPVVADDPVVPEAERVIGRALAEGLSMASLARTWQMLLKGLGEVQHAPQPMAAAEMVLVRIAYAAGLPSPAELVARLDKEGAGAALESGAAGAAPPPSSTRDPAPPPAGAEVAPPPAPSQGAASPAPAPVPAPEATASLPVSFEAAVRMLDDAREGILAAELRTQVHLVRYAPGRIEFRPSDSAESTLASRLGSTLERLTGARWAISLSSAEGAPTLSDQAQSLAEAAKREAAAHPLVRAALDAFPGAKITEVRACAAMAEDGPVPDPDQEMQEDEE